MMRFLRSAFVIARRDFSATVLSKAFIFFLLGPLFPLLLGGVFGGIGARVATQTERPVVAVVGSPQEFALISAARRYVERMEQPPSDVARRKWQQTKAAAAAGAAAWRDSPPGS